jgi:hypothetical protein
LKGAWDEAAQETGNETVPRRSVWPEARGVDEWFIVWAVTGSEAAISRRDTRAFIAAIIGQISEDWRADALDDVYGGRKGEVRQ